MEVNKALPMIGGDGDTSYAMNCGLQKSAILGAKPFLQETAKDLYCKTQPKCLTIADLGCSSGPNSLLAISGIVEAVNSICQELGHTSPEFHVLLNDLPTNDFNTLFKSIPHFLDKLREDKEDEVGRCFVSGVPGSFYDRIFPTKTLHFVNSSYSSCLLLSQVPPGIENKGHIYLTTGSSRSLMEAYLTQFRRDFTRFLDCRAQEVAPGGRMVSTVLGRRSSDPTSKECCLLWELIAKSLRDMVSEGRVEEAKLDSFHWIAYYASPEEVKTIIEEHGSFQLDLLETFDVSWDSMCRENYTSGQYVSRCIRAVIEPMLVASFGEEIMEDLFSNYAKHIDEYLVTEKGKFINVFFSVTKKG